MGFVPEYFVHGLGPQNGCHFGAKNEQKEFVSLIARSNGRKIDEALLAKLDLSSYTEQGSILKNIEEILEAVDTKVD